MELPIVGPSYEHSVTDLNNQRCMNLYYINGGPEGYSKQALVPTPGLQLVCDLVGEQIRGIVSINNEKVYAVCDDRVYHLTIDEVTKTATSTLVGTLRTRTGRMQMPYNPTQIFLVDGSANGYITTHTTDTSVNIVDGDFTGGSSAVFLDGYFIYNTPNASTLYATALNNGASVSALDVTTAEAQPDKVVGLAVDKRELWVFGKNTVEIWYNAANANGFPLSRRDGAFIDQGCGAKDSILNIDNTLMWLDDRGYVVRADGYGLEAKSTEAISSAIQSYGNVTDAFAFQHTSRGHLFYVISFPSAKKTWAYDLTTDKWHERGYWNDNNEFEHILPNCRTKYNQLELVGDRKSGKIYLLTSDEFTDNGRPIHRIRTTQPQHSEFMLLGCDALEIRFESGLANVTGDGSDPQCMLRYSNNGGHTWSNEIWRSIGRTGEYAKSVRWNRLGTGREWIFELSIVDDFDFAILGASVDANGGN